MQIDRWFAISLSHLTLLLLCLGLSGVEYEEGEKSPTYADCRLQSLICYWENCRVWHYTERLISKACHWRPNKNCATIFIVFWKKNRFEIFLKLHTFYCSCCAINFTKWSVIIIFFDIKILLWCYVKWHKRKPSFAHNLKFIALSVYCATTTRLASYTQFYYTLVHIF